METTSRSSELQAELEASRPLLSETYITQVMPRTLRTFDMTAIFVMAIFYITNAAVAASGGATSYIYWILGGLVFFLPCIVATAQLGVLLPHEGSLYNWTHHALGPYWGFFAGICWWCPLPLILVSTADTIVTYIQGLNNAWLAEPWQQGLVIITLVGLSGVVAAQRTRTVQNLVNVGVIFILGVVFLVGLAGVLWLATGHASATSFSHPTDWSVNQGNFGLFSLITLAYLGTQVPLNMAGEVKDAGGKEGGKRTIITNHLLWGMLLVVVCYFITTFSLLVVQGPNNGATPFALISSVDRVLGKPTGNLAAGGICCFFLIAMILYNASFARLLLVGAIDQRLPRWLGLLNKQRVPVKAVISQTALSVLFAATIFLVVPYVFRFGQPTTLSVQVYSVGQAVTTIIWTFSTLFFSINLLFLFRRFPDTFRQRRIFPLWLLGTTSAIGVIGCLVTIAGALRYSWVPQLISDSNWSLIVMSVTLSAFVVFAVLSMLTTSEASFEAME